MEERCSIRNVSTSKLLGHFNYSNLDLSSDSGHLALVYGLNGTGKTTLLNIIYHALSPAKARGHRTELSKIPFERIEISLSNETVVILKRDEGRLVGTYTYIFKNNLEEVAIEFDANNQRSIDFAPITDRLSNLRLNIVFLTADRLLLTSLNQQSSNHRTVRTFYAASEVRELGFSDDDSDDYEYIPSDGGWVDSDERRRAAYLQIQRENLQSLLDDAGDYIRREVYENSTRVYERTSQVYLNLLTAAAGEKVPATTPDEIVDAVGRIASRSREFMRFGLLENVNADLLQDAIKKVINTHRFVSIEPVIAPYLQSIEGRMNSLEAIKRVLASLEQSLNDFLIRKTADVSIRGIRIRDNSQLRRALGKKGVSIDAYLLSSGERQLLSLFCTALLARRGNSLILIDEPELSLDPTWQRRLMARLLDVTLGANVQFVAATHSIEIMAQHSEQVVELLSD